MALGKDKRVYLWGKIKESNIDIDLGKEPRIIEKIQNVDQISCGWNHCMAKENGNVESLDFWKFLIFFCFN